MKKTHFILLHIIALFLLVQCSNATQRKNILLDTEKDLLNLAYRLNDYYATNHVFPEPTKHAPYGLDIAFEQDANRFNRLIIDRFAEGNLIVIPESSTSLYLPYFLALLLIIIIVELFVLLIIKNKRFINILKGIILTEIMICVGMFMLKPHYVWLSFLKYSNPNFYAIEIARIDKTKDIKNCYFYNLTRDGNALIASRGLDRGFEDGVLHANQYTTKEFCQNVTTYYPTNGLYSDGDIWIIVRKDTPRGKSLPLKGLYGMTYIHTYE